MDRKKLLSEALLKLLESSPQKATEVERTMNELEKQGFWIPVLRERTSLSLMTLPAEDDPNYLEEAHQWELQMLHHHEDSYLNLKNACRQQPMSELSLRRLLVLAYIISLGNKVISPKSEEFQGMVFRDEFLEQVNKLREIINKEGRLTKQVDHYLSKCDGTISAYDNLIAVKNELWPIDVPDLLEKTKKAGESLEDKTILLFLGHTGSGKTTAIKTLLGYKMGKFKYNGINSISIMDKVEDPVVLAMHSNPSSKSVTRSLTAVRLKNTNVLLVDTPGFGDTEGVEMQIANHINTYKELRCCKSITSVIVISGESWGTRGEGFKSLAADIASFFKDYDDCKQSVCFLLNRFSENEIKQLESTLSNMLEELSPKEKADNNLVAVIQHFREEAAGLKNFDPLCCDVKKELRRLKHSKSFLPTQVLADGSSLPSKAKEAVLSYGVELEKRIRYHLDCRNYSVVGYFMEEANQLGKVLQGVLENQELTHGAFFGKEAQKHCIEAQQGFTAKAAKCKLTAEDVREYFRTADELQRISKGSRVDCRTFDLALEHYGKTVNDLITRINWGLSGTNDHFEQLKLLLTHPRQELKQKKRQFEGALKQSLMKHRNKYYDELEQGQYTEAAANLVAARRLASYSKGWGHFQEEFPAINMDLALVEHIRSLIRQVESFLGAASQKNCRKINYLLERFTKMKELVAQQQTSEQQQARLLIADFTKRVRGIIDGHFAMAISLINSRVAISEELVKGYLQSISKLKLFVPLKTVGKFAQDLLEEAGSKLKIFLEFQRQYMESAIDSINDKSPQTPKVQLRELQRFFKCIDKAAECDIQTTISIKELKDNIERQIGEKLSKVISWMTKIPQLSLTNSEPTLKRMEEIHELKEYLGRFECTRSHLYDLETIDEQNKANIRSILKEAEKMFEEEANQLTLKALEEALILFKAVRGHWWDDEFKPTVELLTSKAKELLKKVVDRAQNAIRTFEKEFITRPEVWLETKKHLPAIVQIPKFPHTAVLAQLPNLHMRFLSSFDSIIDRSQDNLKSLSKNKITNLGALLKLQATYKVFRQSDGNILEPKRIDQIRELIREVEKVLGDVSATVKKAIEELLKQERYETLQAQLNILKQYYNEDTQSYEEELYNNLANHLTVIQKRNRECIKAFHGKTRLFGSVAKQYRTLCILGNIENLSRITRVDVASLLSQLVEETRKVVAKIVQEIKEAVESEQISAALRLHSELEEIEQLLPPEMLPPGHTSAEFSKLITESLKTRENQIKELSPTNLKSFRQLVRFFHHNPVGQESILEPLYKSWNTALLSLLEYYLKELRTCPTRKVFQQCCYRLEGLVKLVREKQDAREQFQRIRAESQSRLDKNARRIESMVNDIEKASILDYSQLLKVIEYIKAEEETVLQETLNQQLEKYWKRTLSCPRDAWPLHYLKLYKGKLSDFLAKSREHEEIQRTGETIQRYFEQLVKEGLDGLTKRCHNETKPQKTVHIENLTEKRTPSEASFVGRLLEQLHKAIGQAAETPLIRLFECAYMEAARTVLKHYAKWMLPLTQQMMLKDWSLTEIIGEHYQQAKRLAALIELVRVQTSTLPKSIVQLLEPHFLGLENWKQFVNRFSSRMKRCKEAIIEGLKKDLYIREEFEELEDNIKRMEEFGNGYRCLANQDLEEVKGVRARLDQRAKQCELLLEKAIAELELRQDEKTFKDINRFLLFLQYFAVPRYNRLIGKLKDFIGQFTANCGQELGLLCANIDSINPQKLPVSPLVKVNTRDTQGGFSLQQQGWLTSARSLLQQKRQEQENKVFQMKLFAQLQRGIVEAMMVSSDKQKENQQALEHINRLVQNLLLLRAIESNVDLEEARCLCRISIMDTLRQYKWYGEEWLKLLEQSLQAADTVHAQLLLSDYAGMFLSVRVNNSEEGLKGQEVGSISQDRISVVEEYGIGASTLSSFTTGG